MSVVAKALIEAKYASSSTTSEYQSPVATRTIIDKFTATNTDSSSRTISVYLVPSGSAALSSTLVTSALSIGANLSVELPELKNHVLEAGASIQVQASVASKVVIRSSGRQVT